MSNPRPETPAPIPQPDANNRVASVANHHLACHCGSEPRPPTTAGDCADLSDQGVRTSRWEQFAH